MLIQDDITQAVAFVGTTEKQVDGTRKDNFLGTAFFVTVPSCQPEGCCFGYWVTAKHVAKRHIAGQLIGKEPWIKSKIVSEKAIEFSLEEELSWHFHPDEAVDIAILPTLPASKDINVKHIPVDSFITSKQTMKEIGIGLGSQVYIPGLFGFKQWQASTPIIRTGNIAMLPDEKIKSVLGLTDAYLIEIRSTGGISGSPVFVRQTLNLNQIVGTLGPAYVSSFSLFLGLLNGHWEISENDIYETMPELTKKGINVGIAIVTPAEKLLEALNIDQLISQREAMRETGRIIV